MSPEEAIDIITNESRCVRKASYCDRDCASCELVRPDGDILTAYSIAMKAIMTLELLKARAGKNE